MTLFQVSYALLWVLAIALVPVSVVLLYLLAQLQVQVRTDGSGYGNNLINRHIPLLSAKDPLTGIAKDMDLFRDEVHVILLLSPSCVTCRSLLKELASKSGSDLAGIKMLLLCMGDFEQCRAAVSDIHSVAVYAQDARDDSTMDLWYAGFPAALIVDEAGVVVDVRHPLSIKGVVAAVKKARVSDRYRLRKHEVASPKHKIVDSVGAPGAGSGVS